MSWQDSDTPNKEVPPPPPPDETPQQVQTSLPSWAALPANLQTQLGNLQGNIVKGHGRDHMKLAFLRFTGDVSAVKQAIRDFVSRGNVQSALEQRGHEQRFNKFGVPGPLFANFLISSLGYQALGFSDLSGFQEDQPSPALQTKAVTFAKGAKHPEVVATLNDPPVSTWEIPFRSDIHALILLADDNLGNLATVLNETLKLFEPVAEIVYVQTGDGIRNRQGDTIEHFGYIDGRSQPVFFAEDLTKEIKQLDSEDPTLSGPVKHAKFDPSAALDMVLVQDPFAGSDDFGSYFVFRKLEQDVRGFKQQEQALADKLGLAGEQRELAGAYVVGRFEDGTPVVMRNEDGLRDPIPNNFDYADDPFAQKCPFHSHLRKMNPRGDIARTFGVTGDPNLDPQILTRDERQRRIARRGITYGDQTSDPSDPENIPLLPTRDVGLLFMCFQSNIPTQFAFLQQSWANNEEFVKPGTGLDPVIGQRSDVDKPLAQKCPLSWGQPGSVRFDFSGFVTMKGGEFFFAPSITFLRNL